jgi:5-methyltetrahydrofolate--homocysteine methyltransferase
MAGSYPKILSDEIIGAEARKLFEDAQAMLADIISENWFKNTGGYWLFFC